MKNKRNLAVITAIPLALAGCESKVNTVRFGEYTYSREAFELMAETQTASSKPYKFEDYVEEGRHYDKNKDKFLTLEEAKVGLEKAYADAAAFGAMHHMK